MDLSDFPAFSHLNDTQFENLRAACDDREIAAGDELIQRGTKGGELYFLLEGSLQVYVTEGGADVELTTVEAPAVIGELELLTGRQRTASVRAVSASRIMALSHAQLQTRIDDSDPAVLKAMYGISRVIASRLVAMSEKLVELESKASPAHSHELRDFRQKLFSDWTV